VADGNTTLSDAPSILSKAFELLRAFNTNERVMTLSELAKAAELPKSTVHRLLARLIELDAVERHRDGYKLSLGLMRLGALTPAGAMRDAAMPFMAALHRWTGETVHLAVLRQFDVIYMERLARPGFHLVLSEVGARLPASCTAIGKALLAWEDLDELRDALPSPLPRLTPKSIRDVDQLMEQLREVRQRGMATEREEAQPGLACIAAPIVVRGYAAGALSISYDASTTLNSKIEAGLRDTVAQIARSIRESLSELKREHWAVHAI
jgi:DNA-binding IclR family transcriptional regulator